MSSTLQSELPIVLRSRELCAEERPVGLQSAVGARPFLLAAGGRHRVANHSRIHTRTFGATHRSARAEKRCPDGAQTFHVLHTKALL